ncbi:MAG TPA: glycine cleavage T C-terminal barrel domain-containing protein [Candidatus Binataceae bacterium]|nr:glycine cleavage T C-terminal barrel domain-containing protein [Candidatus Binataceae bacterium]
MSLSNPATVSTTIPPHLAADGDALARDYAALTRAAGVATLADRLIVRITGDDRAPFMHGMCSNEVAGLKPGALEPALILTEHAHLIAELYLYATADALLLEVDRGRWPATRAHIEKFLVADDVEIEERDDLGLIEVIGPAAGAAIASLTDSAAGALAPWRHVEFDMLHGAAIDELRVANLPRIGAPAFTLIAARDRLPALVAELCARNQALGVREIGRNDNYRGSSGAREIIRVENGIARVGADTTDKTIALEARLNGAISFTKGCYLGQETIERATARGGLKKRLFGLRIDGAAGPAAGSAIRLDGKEIGRLGSIVGSPRAGILGLAILHHSAWSPGTRVTIDAESGAIGAAVSELPFG